MWVVEGRVYGLVVVDRMLASRNFRLQSSALGYVATSRDRRRSRKLQPTDSLFANTKDCTKIGENDIRLVSTIASQDQTVALHPQRSALNRCKSSRPWP